VHDGDGADALTAVEQRLVAYYGHQPARASVSFVGVEPLEVLRFERSGAERVYVSLGMARRPMTGAAEVVQRADGPRAELLVRLGDPLDRFGGLYRALATLAAAPAVEGVVYTPGMSVDTAEPLAPGTLCTGGVLVDSPVGPIDTPAGPVDVLRLLPATPTELAWCRVHGSEALRARWDGQDVDLCELARDPVGLG
jgi:hypothetical protein